MRKTLLIYTILAFSFVGYSQNTDKEYLLSEVNSSDDLEYEKYFYSDDMLLKATNILWEDGVQLKDSLWYDGSSNVIKVDKHQLLNGTWTHVYYLEYTYDENGNPLSRSNYNSFGGPTFSLGGTYNYIYDENKLVNWELYMNGTNLVESATIIYNEDERILEEVVQTSWSTGSMGNDWKINYEYNTDGTLSKALRSSWSGYSWNLLGGEYFFYDENQNCVKWEHKNGNTVTNKNEYTYNMEYTTDQLVLPYNPEVEEGSTSLVQMNNMPTLRSWHTQNDDGVLIYICDYIYTYEPIETMGTPGLDFIADKLHMYPNPSTDLITISNENSILLNIDILDNTGRVVLKESNLNKREVSLDISSLKTGVYYIRTLTPKGNVTEKLIVK